jgi:hypothetical protein
MSIATITHSQCSQIVLCVFTHNAKNQLSRSRKRRTENSGAFYNNQQQQHNRHSHTQSAAFKLWMNYNIGLVIFFFGSQKNSTNWQIETLRAIIVIVVVALRGNFYT